MFRALGDCPSLLNAFGSPRYINVNRPNPTFTLIPSDIVFTCGTPQTRTFTVSTPNSITCIVSYNWNLGANNGWLYNGISAPSNFSTTTNTITLTSANAFVLPAKVNVSPVVNGTSYPTLTSNFSWSPFINNASITGGDVACTGISTFTLLNLGQNNVVNWLLINNGGGASISNATQSNVTLNITNSGYVELVATISNQCLQTRVIKKTIWVGKPLLSSVKEIDTNSVPSTSWVDPGASATCGTIGIELNLLQLDSQILEIQWGKITQGIYWSRDYGSTGTNDKRVFIYPQGNMVFEYRTRLRNLCGWSDWVNFNYNITSCPFDYSPPFSGIIGDNFILSPVPVTNGTMQLGLTTNAPWFIVSGSNNGGISVAPIDNQPYVPSSVTVNILIYNQSGALVLNLPNTTVPSSINLSSLPAGTYIINFEYQSQIESHTFVKN